MSFSEPLYILLHLAGFAFLISLAFTGFMISAGLMDRPVDRSNHSKQIPTAGGVGIIAGLGAGLLALSMFYPAYSNQGLLGAITALALGAGFLGLIDDIYDTSAVLKFLVMIVIASASVTIVGPPEGLSFSSLEIKLPFFAAFSGAVLWVFVIMNGINFMDGSNGLMAGFMMIAFCLMAMISWALNAYSTAILAALMTAAIAGFIPYNLRKNAFIFAGDVGSLTVGFMFAICALMLVSETKGSILLYVGPILILPFLTDILLTMLVRFRRNEDLLAAHSSHIYQRLIRGGASHTSVALMYSFAAVISGFTVIIGLHTGLIGSMYYLFFLVSIWTIIYLLLHRKYPNLSDQQQTKPNP